MGRGPDFAKLERTMEAREDFSLTRSQYRDSTGRNLPKEKWYIENRSAVAFCAREYGFRVEVVPETIRFVKESK